MKKPAILFLSALAGCSSVETTPGDGPAAGGAAQEAAASANRGLEIAQLELALATMETGAAEAGAAWKVAEASAGLEAAQLELAAFRETEGPVQEAEAVLSLDRSRYRAEEAEAELTELEAMYAAEEFAETTKELVLRRGQVQVEFARRDLEIKSTELEHLRSSELPERQRELELAVRSAEEALRSAEEAASRAGLETRLKVMQKEQAVEEAGAPKDES